MLEEEIENRRREIRTDSYPMSIGEIINLYLEGDLDIHPEFQRVYRWDILQKSRLIESILLGIPLPSIFVAQRDDGIWDVVDGLQRLSTIFSFLGIYRDENQIRLQPLKLTKTEYLPSLENKFWSEEIDSENCLSKELQRAFKREKIDIKIIKRESDEDTKYDLFQRLNTFGSSLSDQEVRNCLMIMINRDFFYYMKDLSESENFRQTIPITSRQVQEQYYLELVLRFFVLKDLDVGNLTPDEKFKLVDVGEFLTYKTKGIASSDSFNFEKEKEIFDQVFSMLNEALGEDSFRKYYNNKYTGAFSITIFEVLALGLGFHAKSKQIDISDYSQKLKQISTTLQENDIYKKYSGAGSKAASRIPSLIPLGRKLLA